MTEKSSPSTPSLARASVTLKPLPAAKSRRGDAVHEIGECKGRIADIRERQTENRRGQELNHGEVGRVRDKIAAVKEARQRMFDLKNEGVRHGTLRQKLRECLSSQACAFEEPVASPGGVAQRFGRRNKMQAGPERTRSHHLRSAR